MGTDKSALRLQGEPIIRKTARVLASISDEVIVVGRKHASLGGIDHRLIQDNFHHAGPLGGLEAGINAAVNSRALVVSCDLPFLNPLVLKYLIDASPGYDAVIPTCADQIQPLHAVYARSCLPMIRDQLVSGDYSVRSLLQRISVRWVDQAEVGYIHQARESFTNVNTREDWEAALRVYSQQSGSFGPG